MKKFEKPKVKNVKVQAKENICIRNCISRNRFKLKVINSTGSNIPLKSAKQSILQIEEMLCKNYWYPGA